MRCAQCSSPFRLAIWILQCGECKEQYCTKCMRRANGIYYCQKCTVLIMRPPDINELMKLKSKDLQDYLSRHNIPTFGLVEKRELVDLLCNKNIPVKNTKTSTVLNKIISNIESVFLNDRNNGNINNGSRVTSPISQTPPPRCPPRQPSSNIFPSTSTGNLHTEQNFRFEQDRTSQTLPKEARPPPPRPSAPPMNPTPSSEPTTSGASNIGFRSEFTPESSPMPSPQPKRYPKLSDYGSPEDLNSLSAKELKTLLTYNRVDYRGCVEKSELLEKVKILWKDNNQKREDLPQNLEDLCKLCMDAPLDCVLLECGHIATCIDCGKQLAECPICRQYVSRVVRTFKA